MNNEEKEEVVELTKRASTQAKNATKNTGRAVKAVAEPVIGEVTAEVYDAADQVSKRIDTQAAIRLAKELGLGTLMGASIFTGALTAHKIYKTFILKPSE